MTIYGMFDRDKSMAERLIDYKLGKMIDMQNIIESNPFLSETEISEMKRNLMEALENTKELPENRI